MTTFEITDPSDSPNPAILNGHSVLENNGQTVPELSASNIGDDIESKLLIASTASNKQLNIRDKSGKNYLVTVRLNDDTGDYIFLDAGTRTKTDLTVDQIEYVDHVSEERETKAPNENPIAKRRYNRRPKTPKLFIDTEDISFLRGQLLEARKYKEFMATIKATSFNVDQRTRNSSLPILTPAQEIQVFRDIEVWRCNLIFSLLAYSSSANLLNVATSIFPDRRSLTRSERYQNKQKLTQITGALELAGSLLEQSAAEDIRNKKMHEFMHTNTLSTTALLALTQNAGPLFANKIVKNSELHPLQILDELSAVRDVAITCNMRLAAKIALKHAYIRGLQPWIGDLTTAAQLGLISAVDRFDLARGNKFSTIATWWIKQAVRRTGADTDTVKRPAHITNRLSKLYKAEKALLASYDEVEEEGQARETRAQYLARHTDAIATTLKLPPEEVIKLRELRTTRTTSFDASIKDEDDSSLIDMMEDTSALNPQDSANRHEIFNKLLEQIDSLPSREGEVVKRRFGIGYERPQTLDEIGEVFKVSRERIRQIVLRARGTLYRRLMLQFQKTPDIIKQFGLELTPEDPFMLEN